MLRRTMIGVRIAAGMRMIAAKRGTRVKQRRTPMTLPTYMLAIRLQTKSFCSIKSVGPGRSPQM